MKGDGIVMLQNALRAAGHELVPDGTFGSITFIAVRQFQLAHGLVADGLVGPQTAAALDAVVAKAPVRPDALPSALGIAPWLSVMRALTGTREIPGAPSNPVILGWRDFVIDRFPITKPNMSWYRNDDTPWCGLAVAYAVAKVGIAPPDAPLAAINWNPWGVALGEGALGAVLVFSRPGGNHVALYEGEDKTHFHIRGGNQSNAVTVTWIEKNRLRTSGIRWPTGYPLPDSGPVAKHAVGAVSKNEA
jgi:uncharacterized protein (TIGR02594 family)